MSRRPRSAVAVAVVAALVAAGVVVQGSAPAGATTVNDESSFRAAFADAGETSIVLGADVELGCGGGAAARNSATPVAIDGQGRFGVTQTCPEVEALVSSGAGTVTIRNLTLRGGLTGLLALGPVVLSGVHLTGQTSAVGSVSGVVASGTATVTDTLVDDMTSTSGNAVGIQASGITADGLRVADLSGNEVLGVVSFGPLAASGIEVTGLRGGLVGAILIDRARYDVVGVSVSDIAGTRSAYGLAATGAAGGSVSDSSFVDVTGGNAFAVWLLAGDLELHRSSIADVTGEFAVGVLSAEAVAAVNSTIAHVEGPGIYVAGDVALVYSTITDTGGGAPASAVGADSAGGLGGVVGPVEEDFSRQVTSTTGALTLFGTVLADNAVGGANCQAVSLTSDGYNFADDTSCALTGTGDRQGVALDPGLGPLGDHGGPGPTRVPGPGSPLVDAIPVAACRTGPATAVTTDERGLPRPALDGCDVGAVEVQPEPEPEPTFTG